MEDTPLERYEQRQFTPPPGSVDVLLIRHGASHAHVPGVPVDALDGQDDPPLAPEGREQAQRLADRLAGAGLDRIFVTTLKRTHETAAPLAERTGLVPEPVADLREISLGDWEQGRYRVAIQQRDPLAIRAFTEQRWDVIPGAENDEAFAERVGRGLDHVLAQCEPDTKVAVVVHGGVIAELCRQVTGSQPFAFLGCDNTSISRVVVVADGRRLLRGFNDTAHLV
jgi:2,3-bisphosphoglycerate-dependent phosphoglycerate mutase